MQGYPDNSSLPPRKSLGRRPHLVMVSPPWIWPCTRAFAFWPSAYSASPTAAAQPVSATPPPSA